MTRLLLDAHLSGKVIGRALRERGHDVRSLDAEKELKGLEDEDVLELAVSEKRVLATADVGDFFPLITGLNDEEIPRLLARSSPRPQAVQSWS